jgi:hypothetical protein
VNTKYHHSMQWYKVTQIAIPVVRWWILKWHNLQRSTCNFFATWPMGKSQLRTYFSLLRVIINSWSAVSFVYSFNTQSLSHHHVPGTCYHWEEVYKDTTAFYSNFILGEALVSSERSSSAESELVFMFFF